MTTPWDPAASSPKRKRTTWIVLGIAAFVAFCVLCSLVGWFGLKLLNEVAEMPRGDEFQRPSDSTTPAWPSTPPSPPAVVKHSIKLTVSGTGTAQILYAAGSIGHTLEGAKLPWSHVSSTNKDSISTYVVVSGSGQLKCTIEINGKVMDVEAASGKVSCQFNGRIS